MATFGHDPGSVGGGGLNGQAIFAGYFVAPAAGTLTSISFAATVGGTFTINVGIHGGTSSAIGANIASGTAASKTLTANVYDSIAISASLSASTGYWLVVQSSGTPSWPYESSSSENMFYAGGTLDDWVPANWTGPAYNANYLASVFATYTAGAGGLSIPVAMAQYRQRWG